jgi:hypothetical protein
MTPPIEQQSWIQTFQLLLHYYLPPLENSPLANIGSLASVAGGLYLVFRGMKSDRMVVSAFAFVLGAWLGYQLSRLVGTPGPISAAVAGVILTALAYRTYRWWLAAGSVLVLFFLATVFQLGRGDLRRYLPTPDQVAPPIKGDVIDGLVSKERQMRNLHPEWGEQVHRMWDKVLGELKNLGPAGWLVPAAAAVLGVLLALRVLRVFSVVWLGLVGAGLAVLGVCAFVCAHWPHGRTFLLERPQIPAGTAAGLWLLGLIWQAKEARLPPPKKKTVPADKDSPKS